MRGFLLVLGIIFAAVPGHCFSQDLTSSSLGSRVTGAARVFDRYVPLPPGEYELVARRNGKVDESRDFQGRPTSSNERTDLTFVHLVSAPNGVFNTAVFIRSNGSGHVGGWYLLPAVCNPTNDPFFSYADRNNTQKQASCWTVNFRSFSLGENPTSDWREFMNRTDQLKRPQVTVTWNFFIVDNADHLWVQYMFNPAKWRIPANTSWSRDSVMKEPSKARIYDMLAGQSQALGDAIRAGVRKRQPQYSWTLD